MFGVNLSRKFGFIALASAAFALAACAAPTNYLGISLSPGKAPAYLQSLAQRSMRGDKYAKLELGICFEEGKDVEKQIGIARMLYQQAAAAETETLWIYSPPLDRSKVGRMIAVRNWRTGGGLLEAKKRYQELK